MKSNLLRLLAISLAAFLMLQTVPVSRAQKNAGGPVAQETVEGEWTGEIKIGKETVSVNVHFAGADVSTGTAEMSGQKDLALKSVGLKSDRVHFELTRETVSFIFDGKLKGDDISGEVRRGKERGTFALVRVAKVDPKVDEQNVATNELSQTQASGVSKAPDSGRQPVDFRNQEFRPLSPLTGTSPAGTTSLPPSQRMDRRTEVKEVNGLPAAGAAQFAQDEELRGESSRLQPAPRPNPTTLPAPPRP